MFDVFERVHSVKSPSLLSPSFLSLWFGRKRVGQGEHGAAETDFYIPVKGISDFLRDFWFEKPFLKLFLFYFLGFLGFLFPFFPNPSKKQKPSKIGPKRKSAESGLLFFI